MEQAVTRRPALEDLLRPVESLPLGPLWLTLAVWAALVVLYLGWCSLFGSLGPILVADAPPFLTRDGRTSVIIALLIAFLFATSRHARQAATSDWTPVLPLTRLDPDALGQLVREGDARTPRRALALDALGALIGLAVLLLSVGRPELLRGEGWSARLVWAAGANALLFVMLLRAAGSHRPGRRVSARIAAEIVEIDLLDTTPLRCFARRGLRQAFYWAGGSSIASLLALEVDRAGPTLVIVAGTLALASHALLDPVRMAARRIRRAKREELARVRERIRAAREALLAGAAAATLPGLLAYERRIETVREWPFDTPTLLRFGALALLATGSWLGGALVERLLDAALG